MKYLVILSFLGLSACASLFERSARSGYGGYDSGNAEMEDLYVERRKMEANEAREELGLIGRALNEKEVTNLEERMRLKRLEAKLISKRDKQQYYNVRSALRNDRERVYFLSIPTYDARERWAQARGLGAAEVYSDELAGMIEANDIALGMSQKAVTESWGDPDAVEVAGNRIYGYERWKYNRYVSGNDGYQKELRIVYFEGGRVVGWERN